MNGFDFCCVKVFFYRLYFLGKVSLRCVGRSSCVFCLTKSWLYCKQDKHKNRSDFLSERSFDLSFYYKILLEDIAETYFLAFAFEINFKYEFQHTEESNKYDNNNGYDDKYKPESREFSREKVNFSFA